MAKRNKPRRTPPDRLAVVHAHFREDLRYWIRERTETATRVMDLVEATMRDPFSGIGKPEPLKFEFAGCWSRRITGEHRLVYMVTEDRITFLQCRYHY